MPAIRTRGLTHRYRRHLWSRPAPALADLDLDVEEGEIFGYLGANGAGKTTTIKILVGLLRPTGGRAELFGLDARRADARRLLGFQPENPYFYEYLTAAEALRFYAALCGLPRRERASRAGELLEFVGLAEAASVRVGEFSKGMRQRLGIAQALVHRPKLVILDEPQSGLDPVGRLQVRRIIEDLRARGLTVFFSSHILSDVERVADRVGLLVRGRLQAAGSVRELVTTEVRSVEVAVCGLAPEAVRSLSAGAGPCESREDHVLFRFPGWAESDRAVAEAVRAGGRIRSVRAETETLEEYFMRAQRLRRDEVGAWSGGADR